MNQEIAKRWVEALRSGEYKQGSSVLKDGDKYCCLGVLCDLHAKETGWSFTSRGKRELYDDALYTLPYSVMRWANLRSKTGQYTEFRRNTLSALNDTGKSFEDIAQVIEKYQDKL